MIWTRTFPSVCRRRVAPLIATTLVLALLMSPAQAIEPADAALDPRFGTAGVVAITGGGRAALQADGKIVVAGETLARYNDDGSPDRTFAVDGVIENVGATSVVLQPDGKILIAGAVLTRYNPDGSQDSGFGSSGTVATDWRASDMALTADGGIILVGTLAGDIALARYAVDGRLDRRFGVGGKVRTVRGSIEAANAVAVQPDGRILVAGSGVGPFPSSGRPTFMLARFLGDGTLDPGFGMGGMAYIGFWGRRDVAWSLALQPDGRILVAGGAHSNRDPGYPTDFALARFNSDGTPDRAFGTGGKIITIIEGASEISGVTLQPDGTIVAAGNSAQHRYPSPSAAVRRHIAVVHYSTNGALDSVFAVDAEIPAGGVDVDRQPDGKVLLTGTSVMTRYQF